jgi:hypothetical protein
MHSRGARTQNGPGRVFVFADREEIASIIAAGGETTHPNGQPRRPLSQRSIQMMVGLVAQILDDAIEDKLRTDNPARAKRMRVKVPKPPRTFLEIDQLDAAGELQARPRSTKRAKLTADQAAEIRRRLADGETQTALRREYGIGASAMSLLANGKTYRGDHHLGWRALCATLASISSDPRMGAGGFEPPTSRV